MKKAIVILILVLLPGGAWIGLVRTPALTDQQYVEASLRAAGAREAELFKEQTSKTENGYLDEKLLPLWAERNEVNTAENEAIKAELEPWYAYSSQRVGEKVDHKRLIESHDPDYFAARERYERILPQIVSALSKPVFGYPIEHHNSDQGMPNLIALRALAQGAAGYLESKAAEDRPEEALPVVAASLKLGRRLEGSGSLLDDMTGVSIQGTVWHSLVENLEPRSLSAEGWRGVSEMLRSSAPAPDQYEIALQNEMLLANNTLDNLKNSSKTLSSAQLAKTSGLWERERRIYFNQMTEAHNSPLLFSPIEDPTFSDYFHGRTGPLAQILIGDFSRASAQMDLMRIKCHGLRLASTLLGYQAEHGRLPDSVKDFPEIDSEGVSYDPQSHTLKTKVPPEYREKILFGNQPSTSSWVSYEDDAIVYRLNDNKDHQDEG